MIDIEKKFRSRKFILACVSLAIASVALFVGIADFGTWSTFTGALLALYKTSDIVDKRTNR